MHTRSQKLCRAPFNALCSDQDRRPTGSRMAKKLKP
jgi:hypothetical protein